MADPELPLLLIIDDEEVLHDTVRAAAEGLYRVESATDGVAGLKLIRTMRPTAVILDLDMPRMDGRSVLKMVRRDASLALTVIAVVSAASREEALPTSAAFGCDLYLEKPVSAKALLERISASVAERAHSAEARVDGELARSVTGVLDPAVRHDVLLVGDATARAEFVQQLESLPSLRIVESGSCDDALARMRSGPPPHTVIADLDVDGGRGVDLLAGLRALPAAASLPVHLVARSYEPAELERAFNLGVTSFLVKPLRGAALIFAVCGALRAS